MSLPKNFIAFQETWVENQPDPEWPIALKALWYDAQEDWHSAHGFVDQSDVAMAKWVHAYLHRKEGDQWNAGYWYRQVGKPFPKITLAEEFRVLVNEVLGLSSN